MSATATSRSDRRTQGARTAFWAVASFGVIASAVVWVWYGFAQFEAQTEQPKALSADTTMAGFAETIGGVPLVLAHVLGLAWLSVLGWQGYGKRGVVWAIVAVSAASAIGILVAQVVWAGDLFQLGIDNNTYVP